jgi:phosphoacetylglucosamine mutase
MQAKTLSYGTAGFRYEKQIIVQNVAPKLINALMDLSIIYDFNLIGIMITASHNTHEYNGVKLIDHNGKMLSNEYERYLENKINAETVLASTNIKKLTCIIGYDTRPSSIDIIKVFKENSQGHDINFIDIGLRTTPEFHACVNYLYHKHNHNHNNNNIIMNKDTTLIWNQYITKITKLNAFNDIIKQINQSMIIDCANGVGSILLKRINNTLPLINTNTTDPKQLNNNCGAAYAIENSLLYSNNHREDMLIASLDGDADRLVFIQNKKIINGSKIACILAKYIVTHYYKYIPKHLKLGFIHTAYTNGACINYAKEIGFTACCSDTGIKHLYNAATNFDIGIYFEHNGHGSIYFSKEAKRLFKRTDINTKTFYTLCNQYIGDGVYLIFLLAFMNINDKNLFNEAVNLYVDLPSKLLSYDKTKYA